MPDPRDADDLRLLADDELSTALAGMDGWSRDGDAIVRTFRADGGFRGAVAFVVRLSFAAEELFHHPELTCVYDRVTVRLTTHDAGGLTPLDLRLAVAVDAAADGLAA